MSNHSEGDTGYVTYLLNERVKELTTLYTVGKLLHEDKRPSEEVLQDVVNALPPGWQYPEITEARIIIGHKIYSTPGFIDGFPIQSSSIKLPDSQQGRMEVMYTREMPEFAEGPFLAEERKLIDMIAEMMGTYFEKKFATDLLLKEKQLSESIINSMPGVFYLFDETGRYLSWNRNLEKVSGYSGDEIRNMHPLDFFDAEDKALLYNSINQVFSEGYVEVEAHIMTKHGQMLPYYFNGIQLQYEGKKCLIGLGVDITERKKAEKALHRSETNLQTIFDNTDTTYVLLDPSFKVMAFNQRAVEFVKKEFKTGEFKLNDNLIDYFPAAKKQELVERMHQALAGEILNYESSYIQTDGSTHWYHVRLYPVLGEHRKPFGLVTAITDITDKKHLEQKILNQKVQEQKAITRAVLLAQEKERNKIGQELHDNVNQILVGAKMHLGLMKKRGDQSDEFLKKAESLLDNGINEIRLLTREQVTPTRSVDLKNMIEDLVKNMEQHSAIKTDFIYDIEKMDMDDDVKLNIYRIIQECLNNIVKHAAAKYVSILLFTDRVGIHTVVSDDGKGFSLSSNARNGIGLNNILNRAESYNGKVSVESGPAKGCRVEVTIPI